MHGEVWMLTTNTARCSAGPEVVGADDGDDRTVAAAGVEEEEVEVAREAIGSV